MRAVTPLWSARSIPTDSARDDFGIEHGVPPVACGGFSAGSAEGNLYVLDLVNRNIKVLRKTDAALLKVVKLPGEVIGEGAGLLWYIDIAVKTALFTWWQPKPAALG